MHILFNDLKAPRISRYQTASMVPRCRPVGLCGGLYAPILRAVLAVVRLSPLVWPLLGHLGRHDPARSLVMFKLMLDNAILNLKRNFFNKYGPRNQCLICNAEKEVGTWLCLYVVDIGLDSLDSLTSQPLHKEATGFHEMLWSSSNRMDFDVAVVVVPHVKRSSNYLDWNYMFQLCLFSRHTCPIFGTSILHHWKSKIQLQPSIISRLGDALRNFVEVSLPSIYGPACGGVGALSFPCWTFGREHCHRELGRIFDKIPSCNWAAEVEPCRGLATALSGWPGQLSETLWVTGSSWNHA